jgi:GNAT superfamily N-acetyltransferase
MTTKQTALSFCPLTAKTWPDLETLFGPRGASGGCWCMWWRLKRSEYNKKKGEGNRRALRQLSAEGVPLGVLAYTDKKPVGWCAVAPRADYPVLANSRVLVPVDDRPVWSVTCFYIAKEFRLTGLTADLLRAAVAYATKKGAHIVEGYPMDPRSGDMPAAFAWTGFISAYRKAGFKEVARGSAGRPIMRKLVDSG